MRYWPQGHAELVARMPALTFPHERTFFREISQVARRRGGGCSGDGAVLARAEPALESSGAFPEHAEQRLPLPVVELAAKAATALSYR
jgi:hypothetical protein